MKYIELIVVLTLFSFNCFAQKEPFALDSFSTHYISSNSPSVFIIYSEDDCFKCVFPLFNVATILKEINIYKTGQLPISIVTNNYSLASKYKSETNLNAKVVFDKKFANDLGSCIIFSNGKRIKQLSIKDISLDSVKYYSNLMTSTEHHTVCSFPDSLLSFNMFVVSGTPFGVVLFDEKMQEGIISDFKTHQYYNPVFTDTEKINSLPTRVSPGQFKMVSFEVGNKMLQNNGINFLHVNSVGANDSTIMLTFSINRCYKEVGKTDDFGIFTSYFLAKKKLKSKDDLEKIFDLNSYPDIYFIDTFSFNNLTYPIGGWISQQPLVLKGDKFKINVNRFDGRDSSYNFGGLATIDISQEGPARMVSLDSTANPEIVISHLFQYQGKSMEVAKKVVDEEKSLGLIEFKER